MHPKMRAKLFANHILNLRRGFFQIFDVKNAAIFRANFADRARLALRIAKHRSLKLQPSSFCRTLPSRMRENILKSNFSVCGVGF